MAPMSQRTGTSVSVSAGANGVATVTCPSGTIVTGGGGQTSAFDIFFTDSFASGNGWAVRGSKPGCDGPDHQSRRHLHRLVVATRGLVDGVTA